MKSNGYGPQNTRGFTLVASSLGYIDGPKPQGIAPELNDVAYSKILPDTGCEVSDSCFTCPLEVCRHDDPLEYRAYKKAQKDDLIAAALEDALSFMPIHQAVLTVSERFSVVERTVYRIKKRYQ